MKEQYIKYGVIGVVAIILLIVLSRFLKGLGGFFSAINPVNIVGNAISSITETEEDKAVIKSNTDAQKKEAEKSKALRKIDESEAQIIANNIKNALLDGWFGEDEELLITNIKKINNQGDYDLVSLKYGTVKNWPLSTPMTMIQHIRDLIHGDDWKTIEDWFKSHKISY